LWKLKAWEVFISSIKKKNHSFSQSDKRNKNSHIINYIATSTFNLKLKRNDQKIYYLRFLFYFFYFFYLNYIYLAFFYLYNLILHYNFLIISFELKIKSTCSYVVYYVTIYVSFIWLAKRMIFFLDRTLWILPKPSISTKINLDHSRGAFGTLY
jgi:hypothetical protein